MFKEFFSESEWLSLPVISLLLFFLFFAAVLIISVLRKNQSHVDRMARLPLEMASEGSESP